jgi:hypothetical protein
VRPGWMRNGESWSAGQRGALVSVGWPGGTRAGLMWPAYAVGAAEERSARLFGAAPSGDLRARDAGALSFPSAILQQRTRERDGIRGVLPRTNSFLSGGFTTESAPVSTRLLTRPTAAAEFCQL